MIVVDVVVAVAVVLFVVTDASAIVAFVAR